MELIKREEHCRQRECAIAKGQKRTWVLQGRSQYSHRTRTKGGRGVQDKVRSSRDQILQGPVNSFKDFGPDSKSKEKQPKTFK